MNSSQNTMESVYEHKMDPKCRVSVPADWREAAKNGNLRLLQSSSYKLPVIRVLTDEAYANMIQEVEEHVSMADKQKKMMLGRLHSRSQKAELNSQGKLLIPKAWCEEPGLVPSDALKLVGRGAYFEIFNPTNYEAMLVQEEAETAALNDELGFF